MFYTSGLGHRTVVDGPWILLIIAARLAVLYMIVPEKREVFTTSASRPGVVSAVLRMLITGCGRLSLTSSMDYGRIEMRSA